MKYHTHGNSTDIHCHECGDDITLKSQNVVDSVILCNTCFEDAGMVEYEEQEQ